MSKSSALFPGPCDPGLPDCRGHGAKLDNCLVEALYENAAGSIGWADEEGGSCEYRGYMWLMLFDGSHKVEADTWSGEYDMVIAAGSYYTMLTDDQGHVYLTAHESAGQAQAEFDEFIRDHDEWSAAQDASDYAQAYGYVMAGKGI